MKALTREAIKKITLTTGIRPKSARLGCGSMKEYITVTFPYVPAVKGFSANFYKPAISNRIFKGVRLNNEGIAVEFKESFMSEEYHAKHGFSFDIRLKDLGLA